MRCCRERSRKVGGVAASHIADRADRGRDVTAAGVRHDVVDDRPCWCRRDLFEHGRREHDEGLELELLHRDVVGGALEYPDRVVNRLVVAGGARRADTAVCVGDGLERQKVLSGTVERDAVGGLII